MRPSNDLVPKCHEKIAATYKLEGHPTSDDNKSCRLYEKHMEEALSAYQASLNEKRDDGGEAGGSSHGKLEIFYRLHASRLKCLLVAAVAGEDERTAAEEEALRLTEKFFFSQPDTTSCNLRDRMWTVLADIVSALASCRLQQVFFHRSVYRHAQALMWAPGTSL